MKMRFDILTIFPAFFDGFLAHGVVRRALENGTVECARHDLRDFTTDKHRTVDDRPFGGGEGMVLKPEPLAAAIESLSIAEKNNRDHTGECVILLSAQGERFTQPVVRELAQLKRIVLICGRYEGVDERVNLLFCDRELSIGDYILTGGELAAAVVMDATTRLLPGVLGNEASSEYESFGVSDTGLAAEGAAPRSTHGSGGLLDYPHYTRPAVFRGLRVPEVLCGGDHAAIRKWRREQTLLKTLRNRPDLLKDAALSASDRAFLNTATRDTESESIG
jgi:tRNA (guanine37-N1)-methyltransferase